MVQWAKNPAAAAWVAVDVGDGSPAQRGEPEDPARIPGPGASTCPRVWPENLKRKKGKEGERGRKTRVGRQAQTSLGSRCVELLSAHSGRGSSASLCASYHLRAGPYPQGTTAGAPGAVGARVRGVGVC